MLIAQVALFYEEEPRGYGLFGNSYRGMDLIKKEDFLAKYNITRAKFDGCSFAWNDILQMEADYNAKKSEISQVTKNFINDYFINDSVKVVHSFRYRVKEFEHLVEKIIRKTHENNKKYKNLNKGNYTKFLTDIIGVRVLLLYKEDWFAFHDYIMGKIENDKSIYVENMIEDYDDNADHCYFAEESIAYIRRGDSDIYKDIIKIKDARIYRSVHYVIKYQKYYIELQARTLFEDGWGEIDHNILYPYYQDVKHLKEYSALLNRLTGLADEMNSYFKTIQLDYIKIQKDGKSIDNLGNAKNADEVIQRKFDPLNNSIPVISGGKTAKELVGQIINE